MTNGLVENCDDRNAVSGARVQRRDVEGGGRMVDKGADEVNVDSAHSNVEGVDRALDANSGDLPLKAGVCSADGGGCNSDDGAD